MVRGLALRSLCSLRLPAMVEYISDPLKASLVDANSYVRKTGVMAILKMWHLWPQAVEEGAMVDTLYNMLQDSDAQVQQQQQYAVWCHVYEVGHVMNRYMKSCERGDLLLSCCVVAGGPDGSLHLLYCAALQPSNSSYQV